MVVYEPKDNDDISATTSELPFDIHENPSKIMCFLWLMMNQISMHLYSLETILIMTKTHVSSNVGQKNFNTEDPMLNPYCMLFL